MDFLHFGSVSLQPNTNIGHLREELNNMVGNAIWYNVCKNKSASFKLGHLLNTRPKYVHVHKIKNVSAKTNVNCVYEKQTKITKC